MYNLYKHLGFFAYFYQHKVSLSIIIYPKTFKTGLYKRIQQLLYFQPKN